VKMHSHRSRSFRVETQLISRASRRPTTLATSPSSTRTRPQRLPPSLPSAASVQAWPGIQFLARTMSHPRRPSTNRIPTKSLLELTQIPSSHPHATSTTPHAWGSTKDETRFQTRPPTSPPTSARVRTHPKARARKLSHLEAITLTPPLGGTRPPPPAVPLNHEVLPPADAFASA
jgi:hypothetical protein